MASQITTPTSNTTKTSKLRVTGLCAGNSPVTSEFLAQKASDADNVSIWWRHYEARASIYMTLAHISRNILVSVAEGLGVLKKNKVRAIFTGSIITTLSMGYWCDHIFEALSTTFTETKMSSFWRNFHHWLHWKLSFWQLPVQPVMNISSKWRLFRFSVPLSRKSSDYRQTVKKKHLHCNDVAKATWCLAAQHLSCLFNRLFRLIPITLLKLNSTDHLWWE